MNKKMKISILIISVLGFFLFNSSEDINETAPRTVRLVSTDLRPPENIKQEEITETIPPINRPAATQPAGTRSAGTQPAGTQSAGTQPAGTQGAAAKNETWYVHVVSHTRAAELEIDKQKIGFADLLLVQKTGTNSAPRYRVLLGPFNQGECAAMLARVKSLGFRSSYMLRGQ